MKATHCDGSMGYSAAGCSTDGAVGSDTDEMESDAGGKPGGRSDTEGEADEKSEDDGVEEEEPESEEAAAAVAVAEDEDEDELQPEPEEEEEEEKEEEEEEAEAEEEEAEAEEEEAEAEVPACLNMDEAAPEAEAQDDLTGVGDDAEYEWQTAGHEFLGRFVARQFGRSISIGTISRWLPPDGDDGALFHVSHLDGDEEDLDHEEAVEALERYQRTGHCREDAKRKEATAAHLLLGPIARSAHRLLQLHPYCASLAQCDAATQAAAKQATERATAALRSLHDTLQVSLGPEGKGKTSYVHASVSCAATSRPPAPVQQEQASLAPATALPCRQVGASFEVGSQVQDSEGTCGDIVARNGAWLTMRTVAGEERSVRKADLKLIAPGTEVASQVTAAPAVVALQAEVVAAPSQLGPRKVTRPWQLQAGTGIGVGSRVQDSEGTRGEIIARNGAWLTMRTVVGKERSMRKADLELITPSAPTTAPTWPQKTESAQMPPGPPAGAAAPVKAAKFKVGDLVIIDGLTSKPELNGCKAYVREFIPAKGRFHLDLLHDGTQVSIKSSNCKPACSPPGLSPPPGRAPFDRKQVAGGASQPARKRGRAAVESTDESDSLSDQSEAGDDDLPDPMQMKRDHEWVGRTVHVRFSSQILAGKVVGWYPAQGDDEALWHVVHEDLDEEDLDEEEMHAALLLNPEHIRQSARETKQPDRMTASLLAERAEAGCRSYAEAKPVHFHLVPRIDWLAFPRRVGGGRGRNELEWQGNGPLPLPPNPGCWLLPSEDQVAFVIAQNQQALAAAGWRVLTAPAHVVARLANKAAFHAHAEAAGLGALLPQHYESFEAATYPCVLKTARGAYGSGTHIVRSEEHARSVAHAVGGELGVGWVLQELVRGRVEIATSLLIHRGRVLQAATTSYTYDADEYVWPHVRELRAERTTAAGPPAQLEQMLALLGGEFQGICNFNYKLRAHGCNATLCVFEVNPRMGSDLGCNVPTRVLRGFLGQLAALPQ